MAFESALPPSTFIAGAEGAQIRPLNGLYIKEGKEEPVSDRRECTYRLWRTEDQPVIAFETRSYDKDPIDLCQVSDAALMSAITVLVNSGITYTENRTGNLTHAQSDACSLLDATALGKVPGLEPYSVEPEYARWRCTWSGGDGHTNVTLELMLQQPGFTGYDEDRIEVDGKPANVSDDSDDCTVDLVHRLSAGPDQPTEMFRLTVEAPNRERLCTLATDLAVAVEKRLSD